MESVAEMPPLLPILFGEYLYNLRAALDYCIYDLAIHDKGADPPPRPNILQFPIASTEKAWADSQYQIASLSDKHKAWVDAVQPYHGDNPRGTMLYVVNDLARRDRHRTLNVVGSYVAEANPIVHAPNAESVVFHDIDPFVFVEDSAVIARFHVSPFTRGDHVEANPQTAMDIEIAEFVEIRTPDMEWLYLPLPRRLRAIERLVQSIIGRFERDCTGFTRFKGLREESEIEKLEQARRPTE